MNYNEIKAIASDFGWSVKTSDIDGALILTNLGAPDCEPYLDEPYTLVLTTSQMMGMGQEYFIWRYLMGKTDFKIWNSLHEIKMYGQQAFSVE